MAKSPTSGVAGFLFEIVSTIAVAASVVSAGGCATLAHGTRQDVAVTSEPAQADVFIDGERMGATPLTVSLKRRRKDIVLRFAKEGFADAQVPLKRGTSAWIGADVAISLNPFAAQGLDSVSQWPLAAGNALATTLGIDFLTGAAYKLPKSVRVVLSPHR